MKKLKPVDEIKISSTISQHISRLNLLSLINEQDNSSSELAGYEIRLIFLFLVNFSMNRGNWNPIMLT
jgi:hypothetical protein